MMGRAPWRSCLSPLMSEQGSLERVKHCFITKNIFKKIIVYLTWAGKYQLWAKILAFRKNITNWNTEMLQGQAVNGQAAL